VVDTSGATQALGVSLGAHTVLRLLCAHPDRFARVVLFLPAALDTPPVRRDGLLAALRASDEEAVKQWVAGEAPAGADAYVAARTAYLLSSPGLVGVLEQLGEAPVPAPALLGAVTADVLVLSVEGDPVHPADVGRRLASLLPSASLVVFDRPGVMWNERARLRDLVRTHLS
jgi:pimeloyl-ACP methyl ester carboxylesterase